MRNVGDCVTMTRMKTNQALDLPGEPDSPNTDEGHPDRGARARERLLLEAVRIFAGKGYAQASTREICQAAGLNVASIHYYFGDKAGLYRAVLLRPLEALQAGFARFDDPALSLPEALRRFMAAFLCPVGMDELAACAMRLHLREMIEPTPGCRDVIVEHVRPHHQALVTWLGRHVGAEVLDNGLHQLAFALVAMVHDYAKSRECIDLLAPSLLQDPQAIEEVLGRLVGYGVALVAHERAQRNNNSNGRT